MAAVDLWLCRLMKHAEPRGAVWNHGYYFGHCPRCGDHLIRRRKHGRWQPVPRGYRIVWRRMTVEEREFREKMGLSRQAAPRGAVTIPHVEHPIPADTHAYPSAGRRATQRGGRLGLIWRGQDIHIKAVMSHAGLSRMRDRLDAIDALIKDD